MSKLKKPISFEQYKNTKDFIEAIESDKLYDELRPKKEKPSESIPPKIYPVK